MTENKSKDLTLIGPTKKMLRTSESLTDGELRDRIIKEVLRRVEECKRVKNSASNCIGTALYIVGENGADRYEDDNLYMICSKFRSLKVLSEPIVGCLVAWHRNIDYFNHIQHMAVVTSTSPLLVANRLGEGGKFVKDYPFSKVDNVYSIPDFRIATFHVPSIMELSERRDVYARTAVLKFLGVK